MKQKLLSTVMALLLFVLGGCSESSLNPSDWGKTEKGAAIGGVSGAVLGGAIGSETGSTAGGALIGGAAGALGGGLIGRELEDQDEEIDEIRRRERARYRDYD